MKIQLLVLHRREDYPGQHAPEILSFVDEVILDENPTWWDQEITHQKARIGNDAAAWAVASATIDTDTLMAALYPHATLTIDT